MRLQDADNGFHIYLYDVLRLCLGYSSSGENILSFSRRLLPIVQNLF